MEDESKEITLEVQYDYLFKILLIGDSGVGKSCLLLRFVDDSHRESYLSTIGVDFKIKTIRLDGKVIKLQIWDTAGQERFRTITSSYYRGAHGVMIVYDITKRETYNNLHKWLIEVETHAAEGVITMLVGNKIDLDSDREVSEETGREWALSHDMPFIETSARGSRNVKDAFFLLARLLNNHIAENAAKQGILIGANGNVLRAGHNVESQQKCSCNN